MKWNWVRMEGDEFKIKTNMFKNELNNSGLSSTTTSVSQPSTVGHKNWRITFLSAGLHKHYNHRHTVHSVTTWTSVCSSHRHTSVCAGFLSLTHTHTEGARERERKTLPFTAHLICKWNICSNFTPSSSVVFLQAALPLSQTIFINI